MRIAIVAGILLILAGAFILVFGGTFTTRETILDVGGLSVTADEKHSIQPWIAGLAILGGIGLVFVGARKGN
jgi:uncharacterized membrane protein